MEYYERDKKILWGIKINTIPLGEERNGIEKLGTEIKKEILRRLVKFLSMKYRTTVLYTK